MGRLARPSGVPKSPDARKPAFSSRNRRKWASPRRVRCGQRRNSASAPPVAIMVSATRKPTGRSRERPIPIFATPTAGTTSASSKGVKRAFARAPALMTNPRSISPARSEPNAANAALRTVLMRTLLPGNVPPRMARSSSGSPSGIQSLGRTIFRSFNTIKRRWDKLAIAATNARRVKAGPHAFSLASRSENGWGERGSSSTWA